MSRDKSAEQIARASYEAFSRRDRAAFEALIADDFRADRVQAIEGVLFAEIEVGLFLLIAQRLF